MTIYNKLVRDKIPAIIEAGGDKANIRVLEPDEYRRELERKLDEEVAEFQRDKNLEELADILEVVYGLASSLGHGKEALLEAYERKHEARGGFENRIYLISKEEVC